MTAEVASPGVSNGAADALMALAAAEAAQIELEAGTTLCGVQPISVTKPDDSQLVSLIRRRCFFWAG